MPAPNPGTFMFDFDEFKWQATLPGKEANITVSPNYNPLVALLTADKQFGFVPQGSAFYWEEYDKSITVTIVSIPSANEI